MMKEIQEILQEVLYAIVLTLSINDKLMTDTDLILFDDFITIVSFYPTMADTDH